MALGFGATGSLMENPISSQHRLLVLAPTRRAVSETFVRANLQGLPFDVKAFFGDERPLNHPWRLAYGLAILLSKAFTRLRWLCLAGWPASVVTYGLIRLYRPQAVMVEFGFEAVRVMEACAWTGMPLVVHFRGADASARDRLGVLNRHYRRLMRIAAGVIVKSQPMAQTIVSLGARPDRVLISPSGANHALFKGSAPAIAPPVFLAVGRFVEKKGPLHTIRAFSLLETATQHREQRPQLWMVGEGPLLEEAKTLVQSLGLQDRVHLLGLRTQEEVAALMREVRGFVQHSLVASDGDSEGSPVAVMEAQLSGLPVVATRHAGIPEVVLEGESGFLVEEGDIAAMAMAISRLIKDPELAARLGDCGRRRIQEGFTIDHHLRQVSGLVLKVIEESS